MTSENLKKILEKLPKDEWIFPSQIKEKARGLYKRPGSVPHLLWKKGLVERKRYGEYSKFYVYRRK